MKKIFSFTLIIVSLVACEDKKKVMLLEKELNKTVLNLEKRDSILADYLGFITEVEKNLNEIREREAMISLREEEFQAGNQEPKDQIIRDLKTINSLMKENKDKIDMLNTNLHGSISQIRQLNSLVQQLEQRVDLKEIEIEKLNKQLAYLLDENQMLKIRVDSLFAENNTKEETIHKQNERIDRLDDRLHTAYYASGSKNELLDKEIILKKGGLLGIGSVEQLNENLNFEKLEHIDIRNTFSIPVHSRKAELVTDHPKDSYDLIVDNKENVVDKLVILDPDRFWSSSKCLVMVTR